jgi:hypothetical protein
MSALTHRMPTVDDLSEFPLLAARAELWHLMEGVRISDLTPCEVVATLARNLQHNSTKSI